MVVDTDVIAEYKGSYSLSADFIDHYRGADKNYDYVWEERWTRDAGYGTFIPQAVNGLFDKLGITMDDVDMGTGANSQCITLRETYGYDKAAVPFEGMQKLKDCPHLGGVKQ